MSRTHSRRAVLGLVGASLAALTGATKRPTCAPITGAPRVECGGPLSMSGPSSVESEGTNPRFVCRNEGDDAVRVAVGQWEVHRNDDGWDRLAVGRTGGTTALGPGDETAWVLLLDDGRGGSLTTASTTRYVGPVSVEPGQYAFAVRGERAGRQFEATATFTVE